jgi:hypothetical protein
MTPERRTPQDTGQGAPAGETATPQRMSGTSSRPQEGREDPSAEKQPPDTPGRRDPTHDHHEETVRKGYDAALEPEAQGDGDPGPTQPGGEKAPGDGDPQQPS